MNKYADDPIINSSQLSLITQNIQPQQQSQESIHNLQSSQQEQTNDEKQIGYSNSHSSSPIQFKKDLNEHEDLTGEEEKADSLDKKLDEQKSMVSASKVEFDLNEVNVEVTNRSGSSLSVSSAPSSPTSSADSSSVNEEVEDDEDLQNNQLDLSTNSNRKSQTEHSSTSSPSANSTSSPTTPQTEISA